ncbi:choice-of-anchor I family protein [Algoriphagus antarcticus]|nr:choice-of-anchor I family protein [Algoriphagus antarcticus]
MKKHYVSFLILSALFSCNHHDPILITTVDFAQISSIKIGGEAAAEITAFDPETNQLFVVNNSGSSKVDIVNFSDPSNPTITGSIDVTQFGGGVNSVAVKNGMLAMAVEANTKTDPGMVVVFSTDQLTSPIAQVAVGALPDMVIFSPNGRFIVSANEGEPNDAYTIDPVGTISVIDVNASFSVSTLGFEGFESQKTSLMSKGFRVFGAGASLAQDVEPEYVAIDENSEFAWVTLQENNGMAKVNLSTKTITDVFPFGLKDNSLDGNELDVSDRDNEVTLKSWPLFSYFLPDALVNYSVNGNNYLITANEGDTRDYDGYSEESRVKDLDLDPFAFPNAEQLQKDENMGRYTVTTSAGDANGDGKFEKLYGIGARSFTVWDGASGAMVMDYNSLEKDFIAAAPNSYDDGRSDNKGVEPEGVTMGAINEKTLVFVGMERVDAVMVYELKGISSFNFIQVLETGDAPEGVLFISAEESPNGKPLLIVSSERDGFLRIYQNN